MSLNLTQLDQEGKYHEIIQILLTWMKDYPDDKMGKMMINNVFRKYYVKILDEKELYNKIFPFIEKPGAGKLKELLLFNYKMVDKEGVDSILQKITTADSRSIGITVDYLSKSFIPIVDTLLYQEILTTLTPLIQDSLNPKQLIFLYNLNQKELLDKYLANVDIDTLNMDIPINTIATMDPLFNHAVFKKIFMKLSDNVSQTIDTLNDDILLSTIALQFYSVGDKEHTAKIFKMITDGINLNENRLSVIFCWGVGCLFEGQIYKGDQFLNKVFLYSNESELAGYKKTLEKWESLNIQPDYINTFLNKYFPDANSTITKQPVSIEPPLKKGNIPFGSYYALIIGVEKYKDSTLSLENPVKDANRIKNILVSQYIFDEKNVTLLESPDRDAIINQLNLLRKKLSSSDNLLIFYAGHGYWDEEIEQGYWLPADSRIGDISNYISNSDLRDYLKGINTKHTLLITDACFSGGIFKARDLKINETNEISELYKYRSRSALTSGTIKEVPDRSYFLDYLLKRLDENRAKYLTTRDLFYSLRDAVVNNSPIRQRPVYGTIYNAGDEGGDFIFIRRDETK
jgi:hypothetical protein